MSNINEILFKLKSRNNVIHLIISSIAFIFVFLNIIDIVNILGLKSTSLQASFFQTSALVSMILVVLFLPTFPIFFTIFQKMEFNYLEKLSITIVTNLSFYIVIGIGGFFIGIPTTGAFYFSSHIFFLILQKHQP